MKMPKQRFTNISAVLEAATKLAPLAGGGGGGGGGGSQPPHLQLPPAPSGDIS